MQQELFNERLSTFNKHQISTSLNALIAWGRVEPFAHVRSAIVDYFNQLKALLEGEEAYVRQPEEPDNL